MSGSRRKVALARVILLLSFVACVAVVVFGANNGWPEELWAWALWTVPGWVFLGALRHWADVTGRLAPLRNRGLGALAFILILTVVTLTLVIVKDASPQLGLDLQGGFSVVLTPKGDPPSENIDQAKDIIDRRVNALGIAEPEVTRQGDNVVVDLPGVSDRAKAQEIVGQTAKLEFRPVLAVIPLDPAAATAADPCAAAATPDPTVTTDPTATSTTVPGDTTTTAPGATTTTAPGATTTAPADSATTAPSGDGEEGAAVPGRSDGVVDGDNASGILPTQTPDDTASTTAPASTETTAPAGETTVPATTAPVTDETTADPAASDTVIVPDQRRTACYQLGPIGFEGDALSVARAELGGTAGSEWVVAVSIKGDQRDQANQLFNACNQGAATCPVTGAENGQLAIVLDDEVVSAPAVNSPNLADDEFQITGGGEAGFESGEAKDLALVLRYGSLPVEFTRSAERQISPTLGEDSLRAGLIAGLIGLAAVALYLLAYYRALGLVVVLGLGVWATLMYGVICWLSATRGLTLSLSGVVGIVVSVGTTVDSYVVYFERLKDEVRLGKSVRSSTERGFQKAFRTILTADVASLLGAVLLWWLTVGAVRGFAFFLGLSVVLDVLVAYCFARPVVALLARNEFFTENRIFGVARGLGRRDEAPESKGATA